MKSIFLKWKSLIISLILIVFVLWGIKFYFQEIPQIININSHRLEIIKLAKTKIGEDLTLGELKGSTTWDLCYKIDTDKIAITKNGTGNFISAKNTQLKIFLPALLWKNISIKKITTNDLYLDIKLLESGEFDIQKLFKIKAQKDYKVVFKGAKLKANKYKLLFNDETKKPIRKFVLSGDYIDLKDFNPDKFLKIAVVGKIEHGCSFVPFYIKAQTPLSFQNIKKNGFKVSGNLQKFSPHLYLDYFKKILPKDISDIKGEVNISFNFEQKLQQSGFFDIEAQTRDFKISKKYQKNYLYLPARGFISAKGRFGKSYLSLERFNIQGENYDLNVLGSVKNLKTKNIDLDLLVKTDYSKLESVLKLIPKNIKDKKGIIQDLRKYDFKADIESDLKLKGFYKKPKMEGVLRFKNLKMQGDKPGLPSTNGELKFSGYKMFINTKVFTSEKDFVQATGWIKPLVGKTMGLKILASYDTDLKKAIEKIKIIRDVFEFKLGPIPYMHVEGVGNLRLNLKGKFKNPLAFGYANFKNVTAYHSQLSKPASRVNGSIIFKDKKMHYKNMRAFIDKSPLIISGYSLLKGTSNVDFYSTSANLVTAKSLIDNSTMLKETKKALKVVDKAYGKGELSFNLSGENENVVAKGFFKPQNSTIWLKNYSQPAKNVKGAIFFDKNYTKFQDLTGHIVNSKALLNGEIVNKKMNFKLSSEKLDLAAAKEFVYSSSALKEAQKALLELSDVQGHAKSEILLQGEVDTPNVFKSASFDSIDAVVFYEKINSPLQILKGIVDIDMTTLSTKGAKVKAFGSEFTAVGKITELGSALPKPDMTIVSRGFDMNYYEDLVASEIIVPPVKNSMSLYVNVHGLVDAEVILKPNPDNNIVKLEFYNTKADYLPVHIPIFVKKGKMTITSKDLAFNNIDANFSNTQVHLDGMVKNITEKPIFDLSLYSMISADDIDRYIAPFIVSPIKSVGMIPFELKFQGDSQGWDVDSKIILAQNSNIIFRGADLCTEIPCMVVFKAKGNKKQVDIKQFSLDLITKNGDIIKNSLKVNGSLINLDDEMSFKDFNILSNYPTPIKTLNLFIKTNNGRPFFTTGVFQGNIKAQGKLTLPYLLGNMSLKNVIIPSFETLVEKADIAMDVDSIIVKDSKINIADSKMRVGATIDNTMDKPIEIKRIEIDANSLNLDKISKIIKKNQTSSTSTQVSNNTELPSFVVSKGSIFAKELIINELITNNFLSSFYLTPDWNLTMKKFSLNTAGGSIEGDLDYNLNSTDLVAKVKIKDLSANAAAATFLRMPNEANGTLQATADFTTKGTNAFEFISNANGTADFLINNGRLNRLGSIEYLLRAANILKSGVAGLTLNNVVDLVVPQKVGYFNVIKGTIKAKNGVIRTDDAVTQGDHLSMAFSGSIDMATNYSDITIYGKVSKKISGLLGPAGSVSIGSIIEYIPGLGFMPSSDKGLIEIIPNLNKVPVLGLESGKYREFVVDVEGDLYNPRSVKRFRWIKKTKKLAKDK